ncbi:MAG: hypothetical protein AAFO94_14370, partial [Bacteroidota bacterium]
DTNKNIKGNIRGQHTADGLRAQFVSEAGETSDIRFEMTEEMEVGCIEYADYISSYDITYPKTQHPSFDQWMDQQAMNWVVTCRDRVKKVKVTHPVKNPQLRATERAYAWTELSYLSDELISGYLNFSDTWSETDRSRMINFDLRQQRELTVEDVFKGRYEKFVRSTIRKAFKKNRYYSDADFRKWISKEGFTLFTVRAEGISFSTSFHPIYGQQHVLVPFRRLKPYLKKGTVVFKLLEAAES